jgi:hypothetical protein
MLGACSSESSSRVALAPTDARYDFPSSQAQKWLVDPAERCETLKRDLERFLRSQGPAAYNNGTQLLWSSISTLLDAEGRWELAPAVKLDGPDANTTLETFKLRRVIQLQDRIYRLAPGEFPEYEAIVSARGDLLNGEMRPPVMPPELRDSVEARARQAMALLESVARDGERPKWDGAEVRVR